MPSYKNLLEEALDAWTDARLGALDEAQNISSRHWDFRPTPDVKSVRELVVHILEVAMLMTGELGTRLAWLHHGIAQEMYHRGQLTTYAWLLGIEPALTKQIRNG